MYLLIPKTFQRKQNLTYVHYYTLLDSTLSTYLKFQDIDRSNPPDAFVVLYSVVDKASFLKAEAELTRLHDADMLRSRPAILVGNKIDLARSRAVSTQGILYYKLPQT